MKLKNVLIFALLASVITLLSCEDKSKEQPVEKSFYSESKIEDLYTDQIQSNKTIDSIHPHVINNFASHIDFPLWNNDGSYSIFLGKATDAGYIYPLEPIVEFVKNECSIKKIIASWHKDSLRILTDSLYLKITAIDSNFHQGFRFYDFWQTDSTNIYINLLNINRYGYAKINLNDPELNSHLVYNDKATINITPQGFREKYGDAFCGSLILGTCNILEGYIYGVKVPASSRGEALEEAIKLVKIYITENKDWKELVATSKYLKNSGYMMGSSVTSMGYVGAVMGNYQKITSSADSLYRIGKFNQYSNGYQLYSKIYPNFEFIRVELPK